MAMLFLRLFQIFISDKLYSNSLLTESIKPIKLKNISKIISNNVLLMLPVDKLMPFFPP